MVFCHNCGKPQPEGTLFCTNCGSKLQRVDNNNRPPTKPMSGAQAPPESLNQNPFSHKYEVSYPLPTGQVPTVCIGCQRSLPEEQIQRNVQCQQAKKSNVLIITIMLLFPLIGSVLILSSIGQSHYTLSRLVTLPSFAIGVLLCAIPFMMLILKRNRLFKKVEGESRYCPDCLESMRALQQQRMNQSYESRTVPSVQSRHYENNIETNTKWLIKFVIGIFIPIILFFGLYTIYVRGWSVSSYVEFSLVMLAIFGGVIGLVIWQSPTPKSVDITPNSIVMELRSGRQVTVPFNEMTWVSLVMDPQQFKDISKANGHVIVGKGATRWTYHVKREIILELREAYRAQCGVYPPNGFNVKS